MAYAEHLGGAGCKAGSAGGLPIILGAFLQVLLW